jgi:hypothetical protein
MRLRGFPVWIGAVTLLLDAVWWIVAVAVAVGVSVIAVLAATGGHARLRMQVPVLLTLAPDSYRVDGGYATLRDTSGQLTLAGSPMAVFMILGVVVAGVGLILLIVRQVRQLLAALGAGAPFTPANVRRVTVIGAALVVSEMMRAAVVFAGSWWISHHVQVSGVVFRADFPLRAEVVLVGTLLALFAEVLRFGMLLQHEHDLTI